MSTPGQLLYSLLTEDAAVAALVGKRVYPLRIAQGEPRPAITYQQIGGSGLRCSSYTRYRFQLSVFADKYAEAVALTDAVQAALDGYEAGEILIEADAPATDQFSEGATAYYRTQDYFIEFPNPTDV